MFNIVDLKVLFSVILSRDVIRFLDVCVEISKLFSERIHALEGQLFVKIEPLCYPEIVKYSTLNELLELIQ